MKAMRLAAAAAFVALSCGTASAQSALRIGLAEDPVVSDVSSFDAVLLEPQEEMIAEKMIAINNLFSMRYDLYN